MLESEQLRFIYGTCKDDKQRDISGAATWEFLSILASYQLPSQGLLCEMTNLSPRKIRAALGSQKAKPKRFCPLDVVDKVLMAIGIPEKLSSIIIIPNSSPYDAFMMATYEFVDSTTEQLIGTFDDIRKRTRELIELRAQRLALTPWT